MQKLLFYTYWRTTG